MTKIPTYPEFADINLNIREELEGFVHQFPCYSDFNVASLYCWNIDEDMKVSWLNGNAAFKFSDYVSGEPFYSFIGDQEISKTAKELIRAAKVQKYIRELKLVPGICAEELSDTGEFEVIEDRDNHDYILSIDALAEIKGRKQAHTRELVNRFSRDWGDRTAFSEIDLQSEEVRNRLFEIFHAREAAKNENDEANELEAFRRLLDGNDAFDLHGYGIEVEGELQAFILCELLPGDHVMAHFWKAQTEYRGIYQYLLHKTASKLQSHKYHFMNFEQDLGIQGLRASKEYLRPADFLKKYTVKSLGGTAIAAN